MEINPVAFGYLIRNIRKNGLEDRISCSRGNCSDLLTGTYDRIIMGHFNAVTFLPSALMHAREGCVIHLHSIGADEELIKKCVESTGFSATVHVHKVKKYRPHVWHVVQDVTIS